VYKLSWALSAGETVVVKGRERLRPVGSRAEGVVDKNVGTRPSAADNGKLELLGWLRK